MPICGQSSDASQGDAAGHLVPPRAGHSAVACVLDQASVGQVTAPLPCASLGVVAAHLGGFLGGQVGVVGVRQQQTAQHGAAIELSSSGVAGVWVTTSSMGVRVELVSHCRAARC